MYVGEVERDGDVFEMCDPLAKFAEERMSFGKGGALRWPGSVVSKPLAREQERFGHASADGHRPHNVENLRTAQN